MLQGVRSLDVGVQVVEKRPQLAQMQVSDLPHLLLHQDSRVRVKTRRLLVLAVRLPCESEKICSSEGLSVRLDINWPFRSCPPSEVTVALLELLQRQCERERDVLNQKTTALAKDQFELDSVKKKLEEEVLKAKTEFEQSKFQCKELEIKLNALQERYTVLENDHLKFKSEYDKYQRETEDFKSQMG